MQRFNRLGLFNMMSGLGIFFAGLVLTLSSLQFTQGQFLVYSQTACFVGPAQFAFGLFQTVGYGLKGEKARKVYHAKVGKRMILKSVLAVASADEVLNAFEVHAIQSISEALYGKAKSERWIIAQIGAVFKVADYDILDIYKNSRNFIEPEFAELIIKAMLYVARSDGHMDPQENGMIIRLSKFLDISRKRLEALQNSENLNLDVFKNL